MTKELFNWIKENKSILQETNKVEIIINAMPRNIITEFLIYIRLNDSLNNSIIWHNWHNNPRKEFVLWS